jgi:hypothetical protein
MILQEKEKVKKVKYKLKKGITWDTVKSKVSYAGFQVFDSLFEVETRNKYRNEKEEFEGIRFDSKMEMEFYIYLLKTHTKEEIELQPSFVLQEKFKDNTGKVQRESKYIADFRVGNIVYDVKGMTTQMFRAKEKTFKLKYPDLQLKVVKKAPKWTDKEWIELSELKEMIRERNKKKKLLQNKYFDKVEVENDYL